MTQTVTLLTYETRENGRLQLFSDVMVGHGQVFTSRNLINDLLLKEEMLCEYDFSVDTLNAEEYLTRYRRIDISRVCAKLTLLREETDADGRQYLRARLTPTGPIALPESWFTSYRAFCHHSADEHSADNVMTLMKFITFDIRPHLIESA